MTNHELETPAERAASEVHPDDARPLPRHLREAAEAELAGTEWEIPVVEIRGGKWGE
jgi:hypothetical protein